MGLIHSFSLVLSRDIADGALEDYENAIYEAGLDDALLGATAGVMTLDVDRIAERRDDAVLSAIRQVESVRGGPDVVRVDPKDA